MGMREMTREPSDNRHEPELCIGWEVIGVDGSRIGTVVDIGREYLLVALGLFPDRDRYLPKSSIILTEDDQITLNVTREEVKRVSFGEPERS